MMDEIKAEQKPVGYQAPVYDVSIRNKLIASGQWVEKHCYVTTKVEYLMERIK